MPVPTAISKKKIRFTLGVETSTALIALAILIFLCCFETLWLGSGVSQAFSFVRADGDPLVTGIALVYLAAGLYLAYLLILLTLGSRWYCKAVYTAFVTLALVAEYGYQKALGRFTNLYDVIAALSATREQQVDSLHAFLNYWALVPLILFAAGAVFVRDEKRFGVKAMSIFTAVCIALCVHFSYVNEFFFERQFSSSSLASFFQTSVDFAMYQPVAAIAPPKRDIVDIPASAGPPNKNIIFIFDESVRADHLSLNGYRRKTTPYLDELSQKHLLKNWGTAVSMATSSHMSYDMFVSGSTPEMTQQKKLEDINTMPSIFQYAKAMNYRTHLIDGQMKYYWGGIQDDTKYIDDFVSLADLDSPDRVEDFERGSKLTDRGDGRNALKQWEIDKKIAGLVKEIFSNSTGNFVFIYKRGVHFPYEKNYPEASTVWSPVYLFSEQWEVPPENQKEAVINSYDNSIAYNLDSFFRSLADDYSKLPNNTVIIYTSDHGESLFADGKAGHGGTTRVEASVPLFAFGFSSDVDTGFRAHHSNVFTTLLDLMDYPRELRKYGYASSLLTSHESDSTERFYNPTPANRLPFE